jgi:excisionase family DNA binding protein
MRPALALTKEVLNVAEVAQYLGLSESLIRRLIREKKIPFQKVESRYLFFLPAIKEWLASITIKPGDLDGDSEEEKAKQIALEIWNNSVRR